VHRAVKFIELGLIEEISPDDKTKINSYIQAYISFYARFKDADTRRRTVDKALWAFGQFLKAWEATPMEVRLLNEPPPNPSAPLPNGSLILTGRKNVA